MEEAFTAPPGKTALTPNEEATYSQLATQRKHSALRGRGHGIAGYDFQVDVECRVFSGRVCVKTTSSVAVFAENNSNLPRMRWRRGQASQPWERAKRRDKICALEQQ